MAKIPVGETAFEGVRLIVRRPLAVLTWAAVLFVATVIPIALFFSAIAPAFLEIMKTATTNAEPSTADIFAMEARMMAVNPIITLCSLVGRVVLACAIFRAVLEPQDSRFGYVRFGKAELLTGLVYVVFLIIMVMLLVAGAGVVVALALAASIASKTAAVAVGILLGIALFVAFGWVALRLAMALPMTFTERKFRFFESWELMRGHVMELFLVNLLIVVIVLLLELIIGCVAGAIVIAVFMARPMNEAAWTAFFSRPLAEWAGQLAPWLLLFGVVVSILGAALYAIMYAPFAAAYRALVPIPATETA